MKCRTLSCVYHLSDVELENRLHEAGTLHRATVELCQRRACRLQKALDVAEHLHSIVSDISSQLSQIRDDSVAVRNIPASDRATVQRHLSELQAGAFLIGELPKLCVKIHLIADWSVAHFIVIVDDKEMGHKPISYQDEFSRII